MRTARKRKKSQMPVALAVWIIVGICLVFGGVSAWLMRPEPGGEILTPASPQPDRLDLSAWVVDWQWQAGLRDMRGLTDKLTEVQAFAAYFDGEDRLHFTPEARAALPEMLAASRESSLVHVALTVVNDRIGLDGTAAEQKDPALISRLMATPESRARHIDDILAALAEFDFHGVEIDYERVAAEDWDNVLLFYKELHDRLSVEGKTLRIVLEPGTSLSRLALPEGPTYVLMAYNLFGNRTDPGPKANLGYIATLAKSLKKLPGEHAMALSVGGFDWDETGQAVAVTEEKAAELAKGSEQPAERDPASGSLFFTYRDASDRTHTVWYADAATLQSWIGVAQAAGINKIALWRLGGLSGETLARLNE